MNGIVMSSISTNPTDPHLMPMIEASFARAQESTEDKENKEEKLPPMRGADHESG
jgi:hypothetical protein